MNIKSILNNKKTKVFVLLLLPLIFVYVGKLLISENQISHLYCIDPEYAYLFNGLNLAHLSLPYHIDHPGTPLQILFAIDIRLVYLFRSNTSIDADVFQNPELYINTVKISLCLLHALTLFLVGFFIYKRTNNLLLGLFLQLIPFVSYPTLTLLNRIVIEQLFISIVPFLILVTILYLKEPDYKKNLIDKYLILFSLIVGLGLATKITFAPLFFVPFFLISGYKKRILYFLFSLVSFGIFAFPIFNRWVYFRNWVENLFIHTGIYGSGSTGIVNFVEFKNSLISLFSFDYFFFIVVTIIVLGCLLYYIPFLRIKENNDRYYKCLLGLTTALVFMVIVVAKHYKYTYCTAAFLLMIPGLYFVIAIYKRPLKKLNKHVFKILFFLIFLFCCYRFEVKQVFYFHSYYYTSRASQVKSMNVITSKFKNQPTLLLTLNYGEPFKEYGLYCGTIYCGEKMRNIYTLTLNELFPDFYFYSTWSNTFCGWKNNYGFIDLLKKYHKVILLIGDNNLENSYSEMLHGINRQMDTKYKKINFNEIINDIFYEVSYDSTIDKKSKLFTCDAELLDTTGKYFINPNGLQYGDGNTSTKEKSMSGKFSSKLTKENPVGLTCWLSEVKAGEHYSISVWKYSNMNKNAGLAVATSDLKSYYTFQTTAEIEQRKWQKIQIDFVVTQDLNNQNIKIFCLNKDNELPAYFDNLEITR